jgi:hypothetical protein
VAPAEKAVRDVRKAGVKRKKHFIKRDAIPLPVIDFSGF